MINKNLINDNPEFTIIKPEEDTFDTEWYHEEWHNDTQWTGETERTKSVHFPAETSTIINEETRKPGIRIDLGRGGRIQEELEKINKTGDYEVDSRKQTVSVKLIDDTEPDDHNILILNRKLTK